MCFKHAFLFQAMQAGGDFRGQAHEGVSLEQETRLGRIDFADSDDLAYMPMKGGMGRAEVDKIRIRLTVAIEPPVNPSPKFSAVVQVGDADVERACLACGEEGAELEFPLQVGREGFFVVHGITPAT